ncbi:DUF4124 domain-containing protein [Methylobacillus sp.]|uniref:DUF4124 domain-containing protein n=1 Tax=Methylobacillus sp. TaxID=56818 RepID=UPI002FE0D4AB
MARTSRMPAISMALMLLMLNITSSWAAPEAGKARIMKWVDEHGVTHYGDTVPPQYAGKQSSINERGLPQNAPATDASSGKESEQSRRDRTLQAVYSSKQEIDLARERNMQMDQVMLESLEQHKINATSRLQALSQTQAGYAKRGKPVPEEIKADHKTASLHLDRINEQIAERKQHMDATRQRFENDKKRFIELKSNPPASESQPPSR